MKDTIKFSIPKPCHEDWNAMTPDQKGRFCTACSKTVVDFTNLDNTQVQEYLSENKGTRVCGRFTNEQLSPEFKITIPQSVLYQKRSFHKAFLLALFVVMGTTLFSCKNHSDQMLGEVAVIEDTIATQMDSLQSEVGEVAPDPTVKGKVLPPPPPPNTNEVKFIKPGTEVIEMVTTGIMVVEPPADEVVPSAPKEIKEQ